MRHYGRKGNWSERRRVYWHPLVGPTLFHHPMGYGRITRMWRQHDHHVHVEPHDSLKSVIEFTTDTGMRYVMDLCDFAPSATDERGKLVKDSPLWDGFDGHVPSGILGFVRERLGIKEAK